MPNRELLSIREAEEKARELVSSATTEARRRKAAAEEDARSYESAAISAAEADSAAAMNAAGTEGEQQSVCILKLADESVRALRAAAEKRLSTAADVIVGRVVNVK